MTRRSESVVRQLSLLDPALRFRSADVEADVDLRIRRILEMPLLESSVRDRTGTTWRRRPVFRGLAVSIAAAFVAVLLWASPADGSFSTPHAAATVHAPAQVSRDTEGSARAVLDVPTE